jgi:hypothetical protein
MLFLSFSSDETSFLEWKFAEFSFTPQYLGNPTSTAPFYPLQLLNYDRDAATDPSLQNNADPSPFSLPGRVSPFRLKVCFAYKRNKAKMDPYRTCFACSLEKLCSIFTLLFASNFSLRFNKVIFASKRNEGKTLFSLQKKQFLYTDT